MGGGQRSAFLAAPARNRARSRGLRIRRPHGAGQRRRVEAGLVMPVDHARSLLGIEPAARRDDRGAQIEAGLQPSGVRAEAVRQHRHVDRVQVLPQLRIAEVVVLEELDVIVGLRERADGVTDVRVIRARAGIEHLVMDVDPQPRAGQLGHRRRQHRSHRRHVHVRSKALGVQSDDIAGVRRSRPRHRGPVDDVRMRQDLGHPAPARTDRLGRPGRQRDHRRRALEEHTKLRVVQVRVWMMRIAKVVHREHQRNPGGAQGGTDGSQLARRLGVETEVHVKDVEARVVGRDPAGVEHHRRPPSALVTRPRDIRQGGSRSRRRAGRSGDAHRHARTAPTRPEWTWSTVHGAGEPRRWRAWQLLVLRG